MIDGLAWEQAVTSFPIIIPISEGREGGGGLLLREGEGESKGIFP
jgi:hypothetical protein